MSDPAALAADRRKALDLCPVSRETEARLSLLVDELRRWQRIKNLVGPATLDRVWTRHVADALQLLDLAPGARTWLDLGSGAGFPGLVIAIAASERIPGAVVHLVESNSRKCAFLRHAARLTGAPAIVHEGRIEVEVARLSPLQPSPVPFTGEVESARQRRPGEGKPPLQGSASPHPGLPRKLPLLRKQPNPLPLARCATSSAGEGDGAVIPLNSGIDVVTARALAPLAQLLAWSQPLLTTGATGLFPKGRDVEAELTEAAKSWTYAADLLPSRTDSAGRIVRIRSLTPKADDR